MGLFRTSLLVVLSCAVMSVQAANWNSGSTTNSSPKELTISSGYKKNLSHNQNYGITSATDIVRAGKKSQRFEARHGDCDSFGWNDCKNDRRRIERAFELGANIENKTNWTGFSIYIPEDFVDVDPANTTVGQVKLVGYKAPMWNMVASKGGLRFIANASGNNNCMVVRMDDLRGKWTDIQIGVDWSTNKEFQKGAFEWGSFAEIWANGKQVEDCYFPEPILQKQFLKDRKKKFKSNFHYDWGIYNAYVSRWLYENKTKNVTLNGYSDTHLVTGRSSSSPTNEPWSVDWGVKFPTQVVFFDEIRLGKSREEVDVRTIEFAGGKPVD
jgi:hypothetical protein